ncbi:RNA chaperone Hfq [Sutcliffiella horikoshii]|uniref:RNA chaperone Hfq n=1 Tax=Sutcliffiella horikoshii TaxID=79883 RepID=UPI001CBA90BA|nr:RNA chaperone Hfq [Sutcliffiella horikoshii]MCM3619819.1 RNA chaperone Hfq [Sutcliffiella horikoshii]UAL49829.1 RNA chaperone Hfq [Sutcliffiella horikoshii]
MRKIDIQSAFLNEIRKRKIPISLTLKSGKIIKGQLTNFDEYTIILKVNNYQQMYYKAQIMTIIPLTHMNF